MEIEKGVLMKRDIAKKFNVPKITLSSWIEQADSIKRGHSMFDPSCLKMRKGSFQELELVLYQ